MINQVILRFSEFLDSYKEKYAKTSSEISIPNPKDDEDKVLKPLVKSDFIMLDFDSMCDDAKFYPKRPEKILNQPSTVDAIYYRIIDDSKMELFLVEFKSFYFNWDDEKYFDKTVDILLNNISSFDINDNLVYGLNRLNSIKKSHGSTIEFSLRLKPYESLFVVLPKLYEEYCEKNNIPLDNQIDLYDFFQSDLCDIKLIIVGKKTEDTPKDYIGVLGNRLDKQYKRLDFVNVLIHHQKRLCLNDDFDKYTNTLKKYEHKTLKSLNLNHDL